MKCIIPLIYNQFQPVVTDSHGHKSSTWKAAKIIGNSTTFITQLIQELAQKEQQMAPGPKIFVAGHGWIKGGSTGVAQGGHKPSQHVPAFAPGKHEL